MQTDIDERHISRLTRDTLALVLAGGKGSRLHELTAWRSKPAVPFGGKFRIVDFALSNCVNSGINKIGILTQYKAHSLIRHLQQGWPISAGVGDGFVEILPASQQIGGEWYRGTADAIYQNIDTVRSHGPEYVLVLSGDHIYKMDYGPLLASHVNSGADMTVSCLEVPVAEAADSFGVMSVDNDDWIKRFEEKPAVPDSLPGDNDNCLASMGNYVFNTRFLYEQLIRDADETKSNHDFGKDIIPLLINRYRIRAHRFRNSDGSRAYWRDVGTIDAYWQSNMELIEVTPELDLYDRVWPIRTYQPQLPPAKFVFDDDDRRGETIDSLVSGGCIVSGASVKRSVLFSGVSVRSHSSIADSVILTDVEIGKRCRVSKAIIDKGTVLENDTVIGEDVEADRQRGFHISDQGVVLVTPDMLGQGTRIR